MSVPAQFRKTGVEPATDQSGSHLYGEDAAQGADAVLANRCPVAVINNDWAPTLAFAFSLGRRNVPLHFYGAGAGAWSRYCHRRSSCPPVEHADRFLPWLRERVRSGEITRLAPTTDLLAYYLAILRDEFPAEVRRTIAPLSEIERCIIKSRFSSACDAAEQFVPLTAAPEDLEDAVQAARLLGYPLIMKPKSHLVVGSRIRGKVVRDEAQLRRAFGRYQVVSGQESLAAGYPELRWPLLQRYLPSARTCVYSVSGIKDSDRGILAATLSTKREQWPPDIGISTVQVSCNDERILESGLRTVDRMISCGIFELELLTDGERLLAIDLNPRAFGFIMLDIALGNDLPWLWWQTTLGMGERQTVSSPPPLECRFLVPYCFGHAIGRLLGPAVRHEQSVGRRWISMLGTPKDPVPMVLANVRLLRLLPHPGGLVRPYLAAAWRARRAPLASSC